MITYSVTCKYCKTQNHLKSMQNNASCRARKKPLIKRKLRVIPIGKKKKFDGYAVWDGIELNRE